MVNRSPFPGMNPFLEEPGSWPSIHHAFLSSIWNLLDGEIGERYSIRVEERIYLDSAEDGRIKQYVPDITVLSVGRETRSQPHSGATIAEPVHLILPETEIHDSYLTVIDRRTRSVVTAIEVLSPSNKVPGTQGYRAMVEKRDSLLSAGANWLEIDLLRHGLRHPLIDGRSDYCAILRRAGEKGAFVWYFNLRQPLPTIAVPLVPPEPDAPLDLQAMIDDAYSRAPIQRDLHYDDPVPPPSLSLLDEAWARDCIAVWRSGR